MARRSSKTPWMLIGMIAGALVCQFVLPKIGGSASDHISRPYAYLFVGAFVGAVIGIAIDAVGNRPNDEPPLA